MDDAGAASTPPFLQGSGTGLLVLGNQLFDPALLAGRKIACAFMREDVELCRYFRFHKQKIVFFLAAMRSYADELRRAGYAVDYQSLRAERADPGADDGPYVEHLLFWLRRRRLQRLVFYEVEDRFFEARLVAALDAAQVPYHVMPSPMFLTSRASFRAYVHSVRRPSMAGFYQQQRRARSILVRRDGGPEGGRWSFDADNRRPLPDDVFLPAVPMQVPSQHVTAACAVCTRQFAAHPGRGSVADIWLPVDRAGAQRWLQAFLRERFARFGHYEDALSERNDVLFHGVLSPFLNVGLLTPQLVLEIALVEADGLGVPLNSLEGFVRQVIGWREFVRGMYHAFAQHYDGDAAGQAPRDNFWGHDRELGAAWYAGDTGIPPLDFVIAKVLRRGWAHHIERLMVVGNLMLLLEVAPRAAFRWFMEMFVDSSDWVMGPNVYGMALLSEGGIFATKPYICGSNYYRKMGHYKKGAWCDGVDGLYWRFIAKHRAVFAKNPRMVTMLGVLDNIAPLRRERIEAAATALQARLTLPRAPGAAAG